MEQSGNKKEAMKAKKNQNTSVNKVKKVTKRVVIVEDDQELREHMVRIFELGGYDVRGAADGMVALQCLQESPADLVLTDVLMPQMDGFALATHLEELYPDLPVVVMSGTRSHSAQFSGPSHPNVRKFLLKPIALDVLIQTVLEII